MTLHSVRHLNRRDFIQRSLLGASAMLLVPAGNALAKTKRTAADQVELGKTGLKLSRLGMGAGSNSGNVQRSLGRDGFNRLVRYAYDHGITYIDTAQSYQTHEWVRDAIQGLPREKLFIQTKLGGNPENALALIDGFRKQLNTDYVDSLLVHCAFKKNWLEERKRTLDAILEAQEKKWVRAPGVSCHSLPALQDAVAMPQLKVHLVRLNPQGAWVDTPTEHWEAKSDASHVPPVVEQIKAMRAKGRGVIGMKLIGNGEFTKAEDREKAIRYVMQSGLVDAVVIGFKSTAEIDEAIERIDRALADVDA